MESASGNQKRNFGNKREKEFVCQFLRCNRSFRRQSRLKSHMCLHKNEKPFVCGTENCGKAYTSSSHLKRHQKISHSSDFVKVPCAVTGCLKSFCDVSALKIHMKLHELKATFQCSTCSSSFKNEEQLFTHENIHMGVLQFPCSLCKAQFNRKSLLNRHMISHTTIRKCYFQNCTFTCITNTERRRHMAREHPTIYECDTCKKTFNQKPGLRDHVLKHLPVSTREMFPCPVKPCTRRYFHFRNLKCHLTVFHSKERLYCSTANCGKSYISVKQLTSHARKEHYKVQHNLHDYLIEKLVMSAFMQKPVVAQNDGDAGQNIKKEADTDQYSVVIAYRDHT